jgi:hypothetical protein
MKNIWLLKKRFPKGSKVRWVGTLEPVGKVLYHYVSKHRPGGRTYNGMIIESASSTKDFYCTFDVSSKDVEPIQELI